MTESDINILPDANVDEFVVGDPVTEQLLAMVDAVARTPSTVLLVGESGVGKEVFAREIHRRSRRSGEHFVAVNCAAIPATLLESELFGHEKGAFTGAIGRKIGLFEKAQGGTILLDEITEMPMELQATLLRVLQERVIRRVGGTDTTPLDVRVLASTNRDLQRAVDEGDFRLDLYYRLNVFPLHIPPLRSRRGDIRPLLQSFLNRYAAQFESPPLSMSGAVVELLERHDFPGNVRELMNIVERAMIVASADQAGRIERGHVQLNSGVHPMVAAEMERDAFEPEDSVRFIPGNDPLTDVRMRVILRTLEHYGGNRTHTAKALGVSLRTIRNKIREYKDKGIDVPGPE